MKTALITGASSGIGRALALELAGRGWRLALVGRNRDRLAEAAADAGVHNGGAVVTGAFDMRDGDAFARFVGEVGEVDLFIANHGILDGRHAGEIVETLYAAQQVIAINLQATVEAIHAVLPGMRDRRAGQIVLISSLAGLSPLADAPAYSASKAGLVMYGLSLREALIDEGVGVSVCCPGYVATAMTEKHHGAHPHKITAPDAARRIVKAALANKRLFGFPGPLWPMALFSLLIPEWMLRAFDKNLRFSVGG